jgi:hypothetical protein
MSLHFLLSCHPLCLRGFLHPKLDICDVGLQPAFLPCHVVHVQFSESLNLGTPLASGLFMETSVHEFWNIVLQEKLIHEVDELLVFLEEFVDFDHACLKNCDWF